MRLLNLGCGGTHHPDWVNMDKVGRPGVRVHDVLDSLPFNGGEFDVVYHSHLLEHLPRGSALPFLKECWRVLKPGGVLRIAVPDLMEICLLYLENFQAGMAGDQESVDRHSWMVIELIDQLSRHRRGGEMLDYWKQHPMAVETFVISRLGEEVQKTLKGLRGTPQKPSLRGLLKKTPLTVGGFRLGGQPHLWMYDELSLRGLLRQAGFCDIRRCQAGESQVPNFNSYQLDVNASGVTRKPDSLFLEARPENPMIHDTPLVLLIYNRPDKVGRLIDALRVFRPSPLHVFSDGPKGTHDAHLVEQCRELIATRVDWTKPVVTHRKHNLGLAKSTVGAVDEVLGIYDRIVVLEDDCIPGPAFMEFMKLCLDKYEDIDRIMSVTGYSFPIPTSMRKSYPWDVYFLYRIGGWGWATWRRAWKHYIRDIKPAYHQALNEGIDLAQCGRDMKQYIVEQVTKPRDIWTPNWALAHYMRNAFCVYPIVSHVQNIGHDGTGVNCRISERYEVSLATTTGSRFPDQPFISQDMLDNYNKLSI